MINSLYCSIFYVTCTPEDENEIKIVGQYSKKIECIVRTALKLRNEDPNVISVAC